MYIYIYIYIYNFNMPTGDLFYQIIFFIYVIDIYMCVCVRACVRMCVCYALPLLNRVQPDISAK